MLTYSPQERSRKKALTEFGRRKGLCPSKYRCICSQHFDSNSYLPSHSSDFLRSIIIGKKKPKLKDDALPMLNTSLNESREQMDTIEIQGSGALSRFNVCTNPQQMNNINIPQSKHKGSVA